MILVLVEPEAGGDEPGGTDLVSLEALAFARALAASAVTASGAAGDGDPPIEAVVVGPHPAAMLAELAAQGVAVVHHADDPRLARYAAAAWAASLADVVAARGPDVVLAAGSPRGSEVLAHLAARLNLPMAANCVSVEPADGGGFVASRQVMGGSALELVRLQAAGTGSPALLTMAGHAVEPRPADAAVTPQVHSFVPALSEADLVAQVRSIELVASGGADLTKARVVVGAGRGVGGADQFGDLVELAEVLGGVLGVSRVVTSLGWRPHHEQVGQTGSRISPDVYIACGISGAIQHWAGCSSAKTIIAINTDPEAPMVTKADYAVIGDLHEIVPAITEELRTRLG
jgi:electron transfer flavoprotein alpha subunit